MEPGMLSSGRGRGWREVHAYDMDRIGRMCRRSRDVGKREADASCNGDWLQQSEHDARRASGSKAALKGPVHGLPLVDVLQGARQRGILQVQGNVTKVLVPLRRGGALSVA